MIFLKNMRILKNENNMPAKVISKKVIIEGFSDKKNPLSFGKCVCF